MSGIGEGLKTDTVELLIRGRRITIPYWIRPGARSIVYLHGMGSSSMDWIDAIRRPEFSAYTLVGFEAPGAGDAACDAPEALTIDDIVTAAEHLIRTLDLAPVSLVGHSLGGMAALLLAAARPDLVASFVNIEGNLVAEDCLFSRVAVGLASTDQKELYDTLEQRIRAGGQPGFAKYADVFRHNMSAEAYLSYSRSVVAYSDHGGMLGRFLELDLPRLFVYGAENNTFQYLDTLRRHGIELAAIANSHHFPCYSNPEALFEVVAEFLARHTGVSGRAESV